MLIDVQGYQRYPTRRGQVHSNYCFHFAILFKTNGGSIPPLATLIFYKYDYLGNVYCHGDSRGNSIHQ